MKSKKELSFIIAVLNGMPTLRENIASILAQKNIPSYEILIIDGGSTDGTREFIQDLNHPAIRLLDNPFKLSEGKGNGKDQGVTESQGNYLVFLDHDNILLGDTWISEMLKPLRENKDIMASQSLLMYRPGDSAFLKYVNALGVEDPFAVDYSLVSQIVLHPGNFKSTSDYYTHILDSKHVLFGGANGCIFRREVFDIIKGYTRDVDVFSDMARYQMRVAVPKRAHVYHKTANSLSSFMIKKGKYYYRFIKNDYGWKKYQWAGNNLKSKIQFWLRIAFNLSLIVPFMVALKQYKKDRKAFWLLHPLYTFYITLEYGLITLFFMRNYFAYVKRN